MKSSTSYIYSAIISALIRFYTIHDIADKISELSVDTVGARLDVYTTKSDGFVLRRKGDTTITTSDYNKLFCKAIKQLIDETDDGLESYISDMYEIDYDRSQIDADFAEYIFSIKISGRLIYVEVDL